jgi:hypothetical protein
VRKAAENDPAGSAEDVQADDHAPPFWDYRAPPRVAQSVGHLYNTWREA